MEPSEAELRGVLEQVANWSAEEDATFASIEDAKRKTYFWNQQKGDKIQGRSFPRGLMGLEARNCGLTSILGFSAPSLVILDISLNNVADIERVRFPDTLRILKASDNRISSIDRLVLPDEMHELDLRNNRIERIVGFDIPRRLHLLDLSENRICHLEELDFPRSTKVKCSRLDFSYDCDYDDSDAFFGRYIPYYLNSMINVRFYSSNLSHPFFYPNPYVMATMKGENFEGVEDFDEDDLRGSYLFNLRCGYGQRVCHLLQDWATGTEQSALCLGAWVARVSYLLGGEVYQRIDAL